MKNTFNWVIIALLAIITGCRKEDRGTMLNNPADGEIVLSTFNTPYTNPASLMILDKSGKTVWEREMPGAAIDFKKWQVAGKTRYTYMEFDNSGGVPPRGIWPTTAVILDENYRALKRVRLLPHNGRTAADKDALDGHDFIYFGDNHYISLAYFEKVVNNIPASLNPAPNCKVVAAIIQEVKNDQVVWEWDSSRFPDLYLSSVEGNQFSNANVMHDYVHMNSLCIDPTDNNLICSNRNSNQVIKISRANGSIMWRLGGTDSDFPMTAEMKFLRQHHATLTDNEKTLLLFDNGHTTERPSSRILEFQLDPEARTVTSFKAFDVPGGAFGQFMGSVQKRGDTYFIGMGSTPKILEVNYLTRETTFAKEFPKPTYRAYKN